MDTIKSTLRILFVVLLSSMALAACEREGPVEEAGESVDETIEQGREQTEEAGEEVEEGIEGGG